MSAHVTANVHVESVDDIRVNNSGRCVWVEIGPDVTVFVHDFAQVSAIVEAFNDAANLMAQNAMNARIV